MSIDFRKHSLQKYLDQLAARAPVPGGGSAAALTSALGAALIAMVCQYSLGKGRTPAIERRLKSTLSASERIRRRLLELVELDAQAYLKIVETRQADPKVKRQAVKDARRISQEICRLNYQAIGLTPFLIQYGNKYLLSDIEVAAELLLAGFNASRVLADANQ